MSSIERGFAVIGRLLGIVCGVVVCVMALHVVADVTGRYLFEHPLPGTSEIVSNYYMVIVIFLPLPYITFRRGHFEAQVFTDLMPPAVFRVILLFSDLCVLLLSGFATWQSYVTAVEKTIGNETVETTLMIVFLWPARWLLVLGFGLMCVAALLLVIADLRGRPRMGDDEADDIQLTAD